MLVIQPIGGHDDWRALFHEAGHTEHFAHTSADLPWRQAARRHGRHRGLGALFEHLVDEPAWLNRRLDVAAIRASSPHDGAVQLLYFVRRYSREAPLRDRVPRRGRRHGDAAALRRAPHRRAEDPAEPESYLADIDGGFYVTGYLRSWAFEAQLRDFLRERYGNEWFARREAGDLLRELWSLGQGPTAEELLHDVTGATLEMASVDARAREPLV